MVKQQITPEARIEMMKNNLGTKFTEEAKTILKDGKILKGEEAREHFNTELNELTFALETLYPLNYDEFKEAYANIIALIDTVSGNNVVNAVQKGHVVQGWSLKSNVDNIINNIKENVKDPERAQAEITLRKAVLEEITAMKEEYEIEWNQDLFWKCWKIKEGEIRLEQLIEFKGEQLAQKRIQTLKDCGGLDFLALLQKEVYSEE